MENTLDVVTKELENEFIACRQNNVKFYVSKLEKYTSDVLDQLQFEISSLAVTEDNSKYKAEILNNDDVDYDFVLRL